MRICIICPGWPGKVNIFNGIFVKEQVETLKNLGYEISVVTARIFKEDWPFEQASGYSLNRFSFPSQGKLLGEYKKILIIRVFFT